MIKLRSGHNWNWSHRNLWIIFDLCFEVKLNWIYQRLWTLITEPVKVGFDWGSHAVVCHFLFVCCYRQQSGSDQNSHLHKCEVGMKLMQNKLSSLFELIIDSDLIRSFSYSKDNGALHYWSVILLIYTDATDVQLVRLKHLNNDEELQVNFLWIDAAESVDALMHRAAASLHVCIYEQLWRNRCIKIKNKCENVLWL